MNNRPLPVARNPFLPLLLLGCAVLAWSAHQTRQLLGESRSLAGIRASQVQPLEQSQKLRASLDSVASNTQRLADAGNTSARLLVDELRKRGITIDPNAQTPTAPQ